jgi:glycerol dehydrogenase-like iron-containing ADH family enzyme
MTPDSIALAECCEKQKIRGPLLIIASSLTVSKDALSWEKVLGTMHISYRVLIFSENSENEIHEIHKEAIDFQATALAAIGTQKILTVVESAASLLNLQLVTVFHESH